MLETETSSILNDKRENIVTVDSYEHKIMTGNIYNLYSNNYISYNSFAEFVMSYDTWMNKNGYFKEGLERRNIGQSMKRLPFSYQIQTNTYKVQKRGRLATFLIRIYCRQHASWQGQLMWLETESKQCFRSVLELFFLIDEVLTSSI